MFRHPKSKITSEIGRAFSGTTVFSNGCFDGYGLHPGHLHCLLQARLMGDRLIVAIDSDDHVRFLKGNERPILPWLDRAISVASLECVDFVLALNNVDHLKSLLKSIMPDFLVKGGSSEYPVGHEIVTGYGGVVEVIPKLADYSTTNLWGRATSQTRDHHSM